MGSADDSGYLASGDDLDVDTRWFSAAPSHSAEQHLNGALHTFVVVLANSDLARDKDYHEWLGQALKLVQESDGRHRLLVLAETELTVEDFIAVRSRLSSAQFLPCHELGEQAVRPAHLGLIVLNEAGRLLFVDTSKPETRQSRSCLSVMPRRTVCHWHKLGLINWISCRISVPSTTHGL